MAVMRLSFHSRIKNRMNQPSNEKSREGRDGKAETAEKTRPDKAESRVMLESSGWLKFAIFSVLAILILASAYLYSRISRIDTGQESREGAVSENNAGGQGKNASPKFDDMGTGRSMGIVTFFHSAPLIGQMKIFNDWEGKYRMKDEGSKVSFYYIGDPGDEREMFSIAYFHNQDWETALSQGQPALNKINEKEGIVFAYQVYELNDPADEAEDRMRNDMDFVISTFKAIKLP